MQKLSYAAIDNLIAMRPTSAETDLLVYFSRYQDDTGTCEGIYYRNACEELSMPPQTFYEARRGLVEKGIITVGKSNPQDCDVKILMNDFSCPGAWKNGYVNTNAGMFSSALFRKMRAGAKLLAIMMLKNTLGSPAKGWHCSVSGFYAEAMRKLGVCRRTLARYLREIKLLFHVAVKDRRYVFRPRSFAARQEQTTENARYRGHAAEVALRRNGIADDSGTGKTELSKILSKKHGTLRENGAWAKSLPSFLSKAVARSLEVLNPGIKENKRKDARLKPSLVARILNEELGLPVRELSYA